MARKRQKKKKIGDDQTTGRTGERKKRPTKAKQLGRGLGSPTRWWGTEGEEEKEGTQSDVVKKNVKGKHGPKKCRSKSPCAKGSSA